MLKKHLLVMLLFIGIIFFIPEGVEAETTVTVCNSGCDYADFDEIANAYYSQTLTDEDLIVKLGEGEYSDNSLIRSYMFNSLQIIGVSKEKTMLNNAIIYSTYNISRIDIENLTINHASNETIAIKSVDNLILKNINININESLVEEFFDYRLIFVENSINTMIENVTINNNTDDKSLPDFNYYQQNAQDYLGMYLKSRDLTINNLNINDNGGIPLNKGLVLDNVGNATINNLTVNNSVVGLYVHRNEDNIVNSNIEVNNSNLVNNTCSSFNILDDYSFGGILVTNKDKGLIAYNLPYFLKKNYQVVFNSGNKLNCAVASGTDTNTFVSGDNVWSKTPNSYTYDEINYDNLTDTTQNVNKGTVDVGKKYKGTVTIEVGSSVDDVTAFLEKLDLSGVTWTSKDESISKIDNGKILGIKEGTTTITGVSSDGLTTYEIEVNVIKNPVTNSSVYIGIGIVLILLLGTALYTVYRIKSIANQT